MLAPLHFLDGYCYLGNAASLPACQTRTLGLQFTSNLRAGDCDDGS